MKELNFDFNANFSAKEKIIEIISLTISGITIIDIKSVYLTLTNEKREYELEI